MAEKKYLIVIGGATATGKTGMAIRLANHYNCEILSCDSRQFYKEMTIGTAKPDAKELAAAKHHFINSISVEQEYSVGDFEKEALELLENIYKKNDLAIVVGGSGLFIRALCDGLDEFPDIPEKIRSDLNTELEKQGLEILQNELKAKDPEYFAEADIQNSRRVIRALEVIRVSGETFSSFRNQKKASRFFEPIYIQMEMKREDLYDKINRRVDLMIENGLIEEAKKLPSRKGLKSLQTVGYQELFDYFDNKIDLETAIELIKRNSRRYAKRQMTWFRKDGFWEKFEGKEVEKVIEFIEHVMRSDTPQN